MSATVTSAAQTSTSMGALHVFTHGDDADTLSLSVIAYSGTRRLSVMVTDGGESREVTISAADARTLVDALTAHYGS